MMRALFLLLAVLPAALQAQTVQAPADQWAEAKISRPLPAEAAALGHHGVVVLEGDVSEGRTANMVVAQSSRSPLLDAAALQTFASARIGADLLAGGAKRIRLKVDYNAYDLGNIGLGYLCDQAVRDADWHAQAFPGETVENNDFTLYLKSMGLLSERMKFAQDKARFEKAWLDAIAACRTRPQAPVAGLVALIGNGKTLK